MTTNDNLVGLVLSCSPNLILVEITDQLGSEPGSDEAQRPSALEVFESHKTSLQIGRYLRIEQGNNDSVIAIITNIRGSKAEKEEGSIDWRFEIDCQPIGTLEGNETFRRGSILLPVPLEPVYTVDDEILGKLFVSNEEYNFPFGSLSMNKDIELKINGDRFFGKHIAVVGSTGSGKSCAVAKILHDVVGIADGINKKLDQKNNSHVIIFDIHSEYTAAFELAEEQNFTLNTLSVDNLRLPYWLMNSEELESLFIESNEANSHNQISQFKQAVILNKERHNPGIAITYDSPVYFSIQEVRNYIENMNREVIGRLTDENCPKLADGTLVQNRAETYFEQVHDFVTNSNSKETKANNGPFNGEFNRFVTRLDTKLADKRLGFLLNPRKEAGEPYQTEDFDEIIRQYLGYLNKANVTVVDLSGVPFEVLSITVSLVSRLVFDFCFHYTKIRNQEKMLNDVPVMIVCEEAHNYVPQDGNVLYKSSRKSIERIAKEGRKYGLSLMMVSQRPSEVSETILAQCNNFVALRLTNSNDQNYIKHLLPENSAAITDIMPNLADGECLIVGDAVLIPSVVQMKIPNPKPQSESVKFHQEWQCDWRDVMFENVIKRWRKEDGDLAESLTE